jgi:thiamine biosynthesis lipoprotein
VRLCDVSHRAVDRLSGDSQGPHGLLSSAVPIVTEMPNTPEKHIHVEHVMGSAVSFDVRGAQPARAAIDAAVRGLHEVDAEFSTYRSASAVRRFGRGELVLGAASADLRWVIDRCERLREETGGYFDAYATGPFDPSALVKGWAVQRAADGLRAAGIERFCITAGGDVVAHGRPDADHPWRIGIRHPRDEHALARVVEADGDLAVATSGCYERGRHIVDPRSGRAPAGVESVTVAGPDLGLADAYATAAFAMGADGAEWMLGVDGYESLTILADDRVLATPGFPAVPA